MDNPLHVAVIGASGIGQHHARWHYISGCEIVAFVGSSEATCKRTKVRLEEDFGFNGRSYWDVQKMLQLECPDIVDVSSPYYLHHEHAIAALEAGAHVICEKPLCWDENKDLDWILKEGKSIVVTAKKAGLMLGVSAQYPAVIPIYREFYEQILGPLEKVEEIAVEMEVKGRKGRKSYQEIWIDMGPHPLSLLLAWIPEGVIEPASLEVELVGGEARAHFDFVATAGSCRCEIVVRDLLEGQPVRRFGINGMLVDCAGRPAADGTYCSVLSSGDAEQLGEDFMSLLVAQFAQSTIQPDLAPLVPGAVGLRNLELQLQILQHA